MTTLTIPNTAAISKTNPMLPYWAEIESIQPEAPGVSTFWLHFLDPTLRAGYKFQPGQFNMLLVPSYGEAAISISSSCEDTSRVGHTVRFVGNVTQALSRLNAGDVIGLRGPFGTYWPVEEHK
jgi:NAD(P)H-flavin reductase